MDSRAKAFGHAIHPMLIVFPLGLLSTAVVFDILYLITDRGGFTVAAAYLIAAGIIGGLVAALFGLVDWLAIPVGTRAKRIGLEAGPRRVRVRGAILQGERAADDARRRAPMGHQWRGPCRDGYRVDQPVRSAVPAILHGTTGDGVIRRGSRRHAHLTAAAGRVGASRAWPVRESWGTHVGGSRHEITARSTRGAPGWPLTHRRLRRASSMARWKVE